MTLVEVDEFDYDFLPSSLAYTDLSDSHQVQEAEHGLHDPWFDTAHTELFTEWRRKSLARARSIGSRRLSGKARRCSATGGAGAGRGSSNLGLVEKENGGGSSHGGGGEKGGAGGLGTNSSINRQQQQQQQQPRKISAGNKRPRAESGGGGGEPPASKAVKVVEHSSSGSSSSTSKSSSDTGNNLPSDEAVMMRQRLEEFRLAKMNKERGQSRSGTTSKAIAAGRSVTSTTSTIGTADRKQAQRSMSTTATTTVNSKGKAVGGGGGVKKMITISSSNMTTTSSSSQVTRKASVPRQTSHRSAASASNTPRLNVTASGRPIPSSNSSQQGRGGGAAASSAKKSGAGGGERGLKRSGGAAAEDEEMKRLVALHNKKFKAQPAYVPTLSIKDTRKWEEKTGKSYRSLSYQEREQANNEIKAMKTEG